MMGQTSPALDDCGSALMLTWRKEARAAAREAEHLGSPMAGFSELLCLLPNGPQENHNFKTYFIWESPK